MNRRKLSPVERIRLKLLLSGDLAIKQKGRAPNFMKEVQYCQFFDFKRIFLLVPSWMNVTGP